MTLALPVLADSPVHVALVPDSRVPRCLVGLRHYRRRPAAFAPSPPAIAGALEIYLAGRCEGDVLRMLFGLSILRSATAEEVDAAVATRRVGGRADFWEAHTPFAEEPRFVAAATL